jgi:hypothetical protein
MKPSVVVIDDIAEQQATGVVNHRTEDTLLYLRLVMKV